MGGSISRKGVRLIKKQYLVQLLASMVGHLMVNLLGLHWLEGSITAKGYGLELPHSPEVDM